MAAPSMRSVGGPGDSLPAFAVRLGLSAEDVHCLRTMPLFSGLAGEQMEALFGDAMVRNYGRSSVLFVQGDVADRLFVVLEGWVRVLRTTREGGEITIHIFGRGESLAEAAILQLGRYPVTGEAVEASRVLVIPAGSFLARLREDSDLCFNIMAALAHRLHGFIQQVEQLSARSSTERLALMLVGLCPRDSGSCMIDLPLDKTLIAARLGMQPETLSRCLARLRRVGVQTKGHRVIIQDVARLRALANPEEE